MSEELEDGGVRFDFYYEADRPGAIVKTYVDLNKLATSNTFAQYFVQTLAAKMADSFVLNAAPEILSRIKVDIEKKVTDLVSKELLPKILEQIDMKAFLNTVYLAAGKKAVEEMNK